ncbi:MAG: LTA synthase family protein [Oscillospiraceae bacterium]|nr:LTA synthase family protein [Oscillospiraceae bacterium]
MFIEALLCLINLFLVPILACRVYCGRNDKKWAFSAELLHTYSLIAVLNLFPSFVLAKLVERFTPFICNMGGKKYTLVAILSSFLVIAAIEIFQKTIKLKISISNRFENGKKVRFYERYWLLFLIWVIIAAILLLAAFVSDGSAWIEDNLDVDYELLMFTIRSPLKGADTTVVDGVTELFKANRKAEMEAALAVLLIVGFVDLAFISFELTIGKLHINIRDSFRVVQIAALVISFVVLGRTMGAALDKLNYDDYVEKMNERTTIYEDYYIDPDDVKITPTDDAGNLILIYLESMESTYASVDAGGAQPKENYIPNLTRLADENIHFSDTDKLGGFEYIGRASWTSSALLATNAGIPFSFPIEGNDIKHYKNYASNAAALGNILEENGYEQVFLCGSDAEFGGRKLFFEQHGNYKIKDYFYAREKGYIPEGYRVNWGYEDSYLYDIAKKELLELAEKEKPFNLTMLTVDTHFPKGYICERCGDDYPGVTENVVKCADEQIAEFIAWLKLQDFYEDTTIVIMGDHFRMDKELIPEDARRKVYNCFINSKAQPLGGEKNRLFSPMDMFPTVLSAMGFEIKGDRLGLGVDLFSGKETLTEKFGVDELNRQLSMHSEYYIRKFS